MFLNRLLLKNSLFGLVGFNNANNPSYPTLAPSLLESRSNLYVDDAHALLSIENIHQSIKNFGSYNYPDYDTDARDNSEYTKGSKVVFASVNYEYIADSPSTIATPDPGTDPLVWSVIDSLSDYLIKSVYAGIDRMCDKYMNTKKMREVTKSIINNILLFNGSGDVNDLEPNDEKFVGLRIRFKKKEKHIVMILNKIGHQFDTSFEGLTLYLFHDSQQDPIATFIVNHSTGLSSQWTSISTNNILKYVDSYDAGGDFYIGYKQSDLELLGAQAVNKNVSWDTMPITADDVWRTYYKQYSQVIDVIGFSVLESDLVGDKMFDPQKATLQPYRTYGLNLNFTIDVDLTPFFIQEESIVAHALKYNVAMVLMEAMAYNTRGANQVANQVRALAEKQLFHHKEAYGTLADRCTEANNGLSFDFSDMSNSVMREDKKGVLIARTGGM